MSNEEMILAITSILDERLEKFEEKLEEKLEAKLEEKLEAKLEEKLEAKLEKKLESIIIDIRDIKLDIRNIKFNIENTITPQLHLLAENYVPAAKNFEQASGEIKTMKEDMECLQTVVSEHSKILQKLA